MGRGWDRTVVRARPTPSVTALQAQRYRSRPPC